MLAAPLCYQKCVNLSSRDAYNCALYCNRPATHESASLCSDPYPSTFLLFAGTLRRCGRRSWLCGSRMTLRLEAEAAVHSSTARMVKGDNPFSLNAWNDWRGMALVAP